MTEFVVPITVVVADDHPAMRSGLVRMLRSQDGIDVVGEARDGTEALRLCRDEEPTVRWSENERIVEVVPEGQRDWKVVRPADFAPPSQELSLAANSLLNLQATEVLFVEHPKWPKAGPRIEIETTGGTQVLTIAPQPDAEGRHLAVVSGREPVFGLRGAVVERLLRTFRGERPE